jgi:hypothetical protein
MPDPLDLTQVIASEKKRIPDDAKDDKREAAEEEGDI